MLNFNVNTLNGYNGFTIPGLALNDYFGSSVRVVPDLNGDGFDEIVIGAPAYISNMGVIKVIFGSDQPFPASFNVNTLDGGNGFSINTTFTGVNLGSSITGGDFNCDGLNDLAFSAPYHNVSSRLLNAGSVYVLWNQGDYYAANYDVSNTTAITEIQGVYPFEGLGSQSRSLETIDFDNNGCDDLIIGAPGYSNNAGIVYTIFGNPDFSNMSLSKINGTNGFMFEATSFNSRVGYTVANIKDINGDKIPDLAISSYEYQAPGGAVYILFGGQSTPISLTPNNLNGHNGFSIVANGSPSFTDFQSIVGHDINGDGINDVVFAALATTSINAFAAFVYGSNSSFPAQININAQQSHVSGFLTTQPYMYLMLFSIASGNFSGNSFNDLFLGCPQFSGTADTSGNTFVVQEQILEYPEQVAINALNSVIDITAPSYSPCDNIGVAMDVGYFNGDNFADLAVSMTGSVYGECSGNGAVFVIFGSPLL